MTDCAPTVFVVDDDATASGMVARCLKAAGVRAELFASAEEFFARPLPDSPTCAVLDPHAPGLDGLDPHQLLAGRNLPVVLLTSDGDVHTAVRAMKAGAVDFLTKPFDERELLDAVRRALDRAAEARRAAAERAEVYRRTESLTPREREVMDLVVTGMLNKMVARELGIAEKTVKVHRGRVMEKMGVSSLADLVRLADRGGIRRSE